MSKLATPVQYESLLDGLNEVRPLTLADKAKTSLNIPVLCTSEFNFEQQSNSKLLRCNQQGAMCKNGKPFAENVEYKTIPLWEWHFVDSATFSQPVNGVVACYVRPAGPWPTYWCNETETVNVAAIDRDVWKYLPFVGETIWCRIDFKTLISMTVHLWGIY